MRIVPGLLAVALVATLNACAGPAQEALRRAERADSGASAPERPGEDPSSGATQSRCDALLPEDEVAELAGEDLGASVFPPRDQACDWGSRADGVRVTVQDAGERGPQITARIDDALASGEGVTPRLRRGLLRGRALMPVGHRVCWTLGLLAETLGYPPGTATLSYRFPDRRRPAEVGAEHCSDDRITRVEVTTERATADPEGTSLDARQFALRAHSRDIFT